MCLVLFCEYAIDTQIKYSSYVKHLVLKRNRYHCPVLRFSMKTKKEPEPRMVRSSSAWRVVRQMELTKADLEEICGLTSATTPIPVFKKEWEDEYQEGLFHSLEIKVFSFIASLYYLIHFLCFDFGNSNDGAGGPQSWIFFTWLPELVSAFVGLCVFCLFMCNRAEIFCRRRYDGICAFIIMVSYLAAITPRVLLEIRRARFQVQGMENVTWGIDFSSFPPLRTCNDTDPLQSLRVQQSSQSESIGCNSVVVSGNIFSIYILHNLLPRVLRNQWPTAVAVSLATATALVAALLAVGSLRRDPAVVSAVIFQLLTGLGAAYFCRLREIVSREHFAVAKGTKFATEQDRNLLYTLVPRNVVKALQDRAETAGADEGRRELLGREVAHCTVMFCALEPQVPRCTSIVWLDFA